MSSTFFLVYKDEKKQIRRPEDYEDLLNIFLQRFNENKNKKFDFSDISEGSIEYIDDDDILEDIIEERLKDKLDIIINVEVDQNESSTQNTNDNEKKYLNNGDLSNMPGNKVNKSNDNNIEDISCQDAKKIIKELKKKK